MRKESAAASGSGSARDAAFASHGPEKAVPPFGCHRTKLSSQPFYRRWTQHK
jgi:hypothetical protein